MEHLIGLSVYFTVALRHAGDDLLVLEIERLRLAMRQTQAELPFHARSWVVLPDHLHCIWDLPVEDDDFALRWRQVMRRFETSLPKGPRRLAQISGAERGIWARDYHAERLGTGIQLEQRLASIRADPMRHGLVDRAENWPYSSDAMRVTA
jgi:putative transposase